MKMVNIHEAKTHLSEYLKTLEDEGKIVICRHNEPIAELVPIKRTKHPGSRPIGLAKGEFEVPEGFFEPLPDEILAAFSGSGR
ncbi:MAG: type II toxin-antitoxin system prevent-host-death family antitoxin [Spirochaetota bacterium]